MKNIFFFLFMTTVTVAQVLHDREQAILKDALLADRFRTVLPSLMDKTGIDMWLLISREYNEDPVMRTMLPASWPHARRRTILVFYRNTAQNTLEKLSVSRYDVGENIISGWDKEAQPDQWQALVDLIKARHPKKIGINISKYFGIADGLTQTDYTALKEALPEAMEAKLVSAENLAIGWIETRTPKEMALYDTLVQFTHHIIDQAFSSKVIVPGVTTTADLVWWMHQKVTDMGLETWFHPTVDIQRSEEVLKDLTGSFTKTAKEDVILPGDLLHCDFGITYLGLHTDCQQHAYVPKEGETEVPGFLSEAFQKGNRLQDILTSNYQEGKTGNEILLTALGQAKKEGLRPAIYTHPLGSYGHSAGPTIGMWDAQNGVPVNGDYPIHRNTVYAIELNTTVYLPQWKKDIRIMLEEAGFYGEEGFRYIGERQKAIKMIKK